MPYCANLRFVNALLVYIRIFETSSCQIVKNVFVILGVRGAAFCTSSPNRYLNTVFKNGFDILKNTG